MQNMPTSTTQRKEKPTDVLQKIYEELRLLRNELMFLFPQEDLKEFRHPERIKRSYQRATKEHPPVSL